MVKKFETFKLSDREIREVELNLGDIRKSRKDCEKSLVGKIFGNNTANFTGLKQTMTQLWCPEGTLRVVEIGAKMFQFFFSNEDERRRVLERRPWTFDNQLLVLQPWQNETDLKAEAFFQNSNVGSSLANPGSMAVNRYCLEGGEGVSTVSQCFYPRNRQ